MRHQRIHDSSIVVRTSGMLSNAIATQAKNAGVSVSEYVRTILRQRVGLD